MKRWTHICFEVVIDFDSIYRQWLHLYTILCSEISHYKCMEWCYVFFWSSAKIVLSSNYTVWYFIGMYWSIADCKSIYLSLCLPPWNGETYCFGLRCLSVRLSVRHAFVSALYLLNSLWDLQITLHKCQVWWDDVQCLCLTKVGSRSRSQSKIKHCMTVFRVRSISFEPRLDLQITLHTCQVWWDDVQCLCLTKVGSRSQSKIKHCITVFRVRSTSFEPIVGFTNYFAQMSAMIARCAVPMFDQGRFKVKVTV